MLDAALSPLPTVYHFIQAVTMRTIFISIPPEQIMGLQHRREKGRLRQSLWIWPLYRAGSRTNAFCLNPEPSGSRCAEQAQTSI